VHLASRQFRLGFGHKYGRYINTLYLRDLCTQKASDPTCVLNALPSLPNLDTIVTPNMDDVIDAVTRDILQDDDEGGSSSSSDAERTRPGVSFVIDRFLALFASVPSLVVHVLADADTIFNRLAILSPQTRKLVLSDHEDADPTVLVDEALVALRSLPLLSELKLVMAEPLYDRDAVHRFVVPPGSHLRHFALSTYYAELTEPMSELVGKLSPVLRSLDLNCEFFSWADADERFPDGFLDGAHFPRLESLLVTTGDPAELGDLAASLSPTKFPVLRHFELRVRSPGTLPTDVSASKVIGAFASRPLSLPPLTVVADSVLTDSHRLEIADSPLPAVDRPDHNRHSLVPSIFLRDPFSRGYSGFRARDEDVAMYSRQALEPLLDRTREMLQEALQANDHAQLRRVAHALQPCALLRIERNA
jgi:hypothetical protein